MKIALISDVHTEFNPKPLPPLPEGVDVLVLAGDIAVGDYGEMWARDLFEDKVKHIVYVGGNHEGYGYVINDVHKVLRNLTVSNPNFHFLENDTVTIDGINFVGATTWTNYEVGNLGLPHLNMIHAKQLNDFRRVGWRDPDGSIRMITPEDCLNENQKSKAYIFSEIARLGKANTVVVTHHAPTEKSIAPQFMGDSLNCCFANNWQNELGYHGPALWFHGHVHNEFDYMMGDTRVVCNPLGYPSERPTPFEWKIIEISSTN